MAKEKELTPLMKQYWEVKALHTDKILFFRMGDFFELFYDDATTAAPLLGITLTQRNKKSEDSTPMCGMPHHSVANPINKLLALGFKVAICDQVEDPKTAKGIVKRAVTRILTPGMVYDPDQLSQTESHYIVCIDDETLSFVDTTTGECFYYDDLTITEKNNIFSVMPIAEVLTYNNEEKFKSCFHHATWSKHALVKNDFGAPNTASTLLDYVRFLSDGKINQILKPFERRTLKGRLHISSTTVRHLEIFQTYKGHEAGSLFHAINRTQTSSGSRKLKNWLRFPLMDERDIQKRLLSIAALRSDLYELKKLREIFPKMGDIERRLSKIALPQCHGRDLTALAQAVQVGLTAIDVSDRLFNKSKTIDIDKCFQLSERILRTISEDAPISTKQGGMIQKGVSPELDEIIHLSTHSYELIQNLEVKEKERTGIGSLKIRYNSVFGYYIEITNTHKDKVPADYQRKQTLANAERYCTDELIEIERKVLSAQTRRNELEFIIFEDLRKDILNTASDLLVLANECSEIDVYSGLAWLSLEESYCEPQFSKDRHLLIKESRHPVVEQFQRREVDGVQKVSKFISNTIELKSSECLLITGPNMAGKSTLMRQVALSVILAQTGSYVPASEALLPIYDALFTRIGASDQLTEGLSTFMVEMSETAEMLKMATEKSLLIMDEIGRGTATFDGLCLAQSILEYIVSDLKTHVLFATHYHELVKLENKFPKIKNVHMKIHETKGHIDFLYVLSPGPAGKSYGIQVAELAGLPRMIISRAQNLLSTLEKTETSQSQMSLFD